jgi:hypothetical protein
MLLSGREEEREKERKRKRKRESKEGERREKREESVRNCETVSRSSEVQGSLDESVHEEHEELAINVAEQHPQSRHKLLNHSHHSGLLLTPDGG